MLLCRARGDQCDKGDDKKVVIRGERMRSLEAECEASKYGKDRYGKDCEYTGLYNALESTQSLSIEQSYGKSGRRYPRAQTRRCEVCEWISSVARINSRSTSDRITGSCKRHIVEQSRRVHRNVMVEQSSRIEIGLFVRDFSELIREDQHYPTESAWDGIQ